MVSPRRAPSPLRTKLNKLRLRAFTLFWTVTPRGILRALPSTSHRFGPPRRCARLQDYRRGQEVAWQEIFPARRVELPPPFFCNDPTQPFARWSVCLWPAVGVATLRGGRILDEHGWVVGANDTLLGDFCLWGNSRHSRANHTVKLRPPRRLAGRTLNLCSAEASVNFYHYAMEAVGRYALVERAGFTWKDFDHLVLPRFRSATTVEIERALHIPPEKIIRMAHREQFVCDELIQPSFPGLLARAPGWLIDRYRELFPGSPHAGSSRRLYFPRRGRRQALNGAEIDARLAVAGFEEVDPMTTPDLRKRLGEASYVVGVHGAALTNLMFCRPGTRVLEIMPSDIARHHNAAYYYALCSSGRMPYGAVVGPSLRERLFPWSPQSWSDFRVDLSALDRGLAALLGEHRDTEPNLSPESREGMRPSPSEVGFSAKR